MSSDITNVPSNTIKDAIADDSNFNTDQANKDSKHIDILCKLDELNSNLKILVTYFALIMGQELNAEDVNNGN